MQREVLSALSDVIDLSRVDAVWVVGSAAAGSLDPGSDVDVVLDSGGAPPFTDPRAEQAFRRGTTEDVLSVRVGDRERPLHVMTLESTRRRDGPRERIF